MRSPRAPCGPPSQRWEESSLTTLGKEEERDSGIKALVVNSPGRFCVSATEPTAQKTSCFSGKCQMFEQQRGGGDLLIFGLKYQEPEQELERRGTEGAPGSGFLSWRELKERRSPGRPPAPASSDRRTGVFSCEAARAPAAWATHVFVGLMPQMAPRLRGTSSPRSCPARRTP